MDVDQDNGGLRQQRQEGKQKLLADFKRRALLSHWLEVG